jgi:HEAT repeat protein
MKFSSLRFGLKTLLVAVACFAVVLWASLLAWHRWRLAEHVSAVKSGLRPQAETSALRLAEIGEPAVSHLIEILGDYSSESRNLAALALGRMGSRAKSAKPVLIEVMSGDDPMMRVEAASALWSIEGDADAVLPTLREAMKDQDRWVRSQAALALGKIGPAAGTAIPELRYALQDEFGHTRVNANLALWRIEGQNEIERVDALIHQFVHGEPAARRAAAGSLGEMGPVAKHAVPALVKFLSEPWGGLSDPEKVIQQLAAPALRKIDPGNPVLADSVW